MPLTSSDDPNAGQVFVEGVYFDMMDGSRRVRCRVTQEALEDRAAPDGMSQNDLLAIFEAFQDEIEEIASANYDRGDVPVVVSGEQLNPRPAHRVARP